MEITGQLATGARINSQVFHSLLASKGRNPLFSVLEVLVLKLSWKGDTELATVMDMFYVCTSYTAATSPVGPWIIQNVANATKELKLPLYLILMTFNLNSPWTTSYSSWSA